MTSEYTMARDEKANEHDLNTGRMLGVPYFSAEYFKAGADWSRDYHMKVIEELIEALETIQQWDDTWIGRDAIAKARKKLK